MRLLKKLVPREECRESLVYHWGPPWEARYAREDYVARIGTEKHPAVVGVQTEERLTEVIALCKKNNLVYIAGLEPDKPEDITDIGRALSQPVPVTVAPKTSRNDPGPCGSGKKFKKRCAGTASAGLEKGRNPSQSRSETRSAGRRAQRYLGRPAEWWIG